MPNEYDDYEDDDNETQNDGDGEQPNPVVKQRTRIRNLERENRELRQRAEAGRAAQVQLAVQQAQLDTNSKTVQKFLEHYQGDPTPEALRAAAIEWGLVTEQPAAAATSIQGQEQMLQAMGGGDTGTIPPTMTSLGHQVEATDGAMWEEFEAAVQGPGGAAAGQQVLAKYGYDRQGMTTDHKMVPR